MTIKEKHELVRLLGLYMNEVMSDYQANLMEAAKYEDGEKWKGNYKSGLKEQYSHARILQAKLAKDVNDEIKTHGF